MVAFSTPSDKIMIDLTKQLKKKNNVQEFSWKKIGQNLMISHYTWKKAITRSFYDEIHHWQKSWYEPSTDAYLDNIFTAKIFRIILNGKTLLYSGLSWIFWLRSDGLRIASKIMPCTFWSTTQSNNAQSIEGTQKERENRAQMQSWKQIQF